MEDNSSRFLQKKAVYHFFGKKILFLVKKRHAEIVYIKAIFTKKSLIQHKQPILLAMI